VEPVYLTGPQMSAKRKYADQNDIIDEGGVSISIVNEWNLLLLIKLY
jgi:hypothetical protein